MEPRDLIVDSRNRNPEACRHPLIGQTIGDGNSDLTLAGAETTRSATFEGCVLVVRPTQASPTGRNGSRSCMAACGSKLVRKPRPAEGSRGTVA